jgi:hypothetical protein
MTVMNTQIAWLEFGVPPLGASLSGKEYCFQLFLFQNFSFSNNGFFVCGCFIKQFGTAKHRHDDGH